MDFERSDEQRVLTETLAALLQDRWTTTEVRAADEAGGWGKGLWRVLGEIGVSTLALPAEDGGAGGTPWDVMLVAAQLGRHLAIVPYVWSAVLATDLVVGSSDGSVRRCLTDALASGEIVSVGVGRPDRLVNPLRKSSDASTQPASVIHVPFGSAARWILLLDRLVDRTGMVALPVLDVGHHKPPIPSRRSDLQLISSVSLNEDAVARSAHIVVPRPRLQAALALGKVALAAFALGGSRRVTELAVDYARTREQFGRPIGAFQAVAHRCADMLGANVLADALVDLATWQCSRGDTTAGRTAALAKARATTAFADNASSALQVFAGHGFSTESDSQLYYRLARGLEVTWGTARQEFEAAGEKPDDAVGVLSA